MSHCYTLKLQSCLSFCLIKEGEKLISNAEYPCLSQGKWQVYVYIKSLMVPSLLLLEHLKQEIKRESNLKSGSLLNCNPQQC